MKSAQLVRILKLTSLNLVSLVCFLIFLEIAARTSVLLLRCIKGETCRPQDSFSLIKADHQLGFSKRNSSTGYEPASNFKKHITLLPDWDNVLVTTKEHGIRSSATNTASKKVLTVGDSFTFGDQVSDHQTWQSCVNSNQNKFKMINAGVFGYGTVQALHRGNLLKNDIGDIHSSMVGHLVGHDFPRDKYSFRTGFPSSSVVNKNGISAILPPPKTDILGTKYYDFSKEPLLTKVIYHTLGNSRILSQIYPHFQDVLRKRISVIHPESATDDQIADLAIKMSRASKTIWLLQYAETMTLEKERIASERGKLRQKLDSLNVQYIDTYDALSAAIKDHGESRIWFGHHTPLGNKIVCKEIVDYFAKFP